MIFKKETQKSLIKDFLNKPIEVFGQSYLVVSIKFYNTDIEDRSSCFLVCQKSAGSNVQLWFNYKLIF